MYIRLLYDSGSKGGSSGPGYSLLYIRCEYIHGAGMQPFVYTFDIHCLYTIGGCIYVVNTNFLCSFKDLEESLGLGEIFSCIPVGGDPSVWHGAGMSPLGLP